MARSSTVVFLLASMFCTANCSFDKQKLEEKLGEDMHEQVNLEEPRSIKILVTGKTGVGKSTLVNALLGMDVAKADLGVITVTKNVEEKVSVKSGIHVYITDTPGLENLDMDDEDILRRALEQSNDIDLFLYCISSVAERFDRQHTKEMKTITEMFGRDIWKKGLFVLTFANLLDRENYSFRLQEWEKEVKKRMKQIIDPEVAELIPIVPTGFREPQLPDRPNWVSEFWIQGFRRMGFNSILHLIQPNRHKMQDQRDGEQDTYEDQILATCHISNDEWLINYLKHIPDICLNIDIILLAIALVYKLRDRRCSLLLLYSTIVVYMSNLEGNIFNWRGREAKVHYNDEALMHSLLAALEGYPENEDA